MQNKLTGLLRQLLLLAFCNPLMPCQDYQPHHHHAIPVASLWQLFASDSMCMQIYLHFVLKIYSFYHMQRQLGETKSVWWAKKKRGWERGGATCNTPPCTRTMTPTAGKSFLGKVHIAFRLLNEENVCFRAGKHWKKNFLFFLITFFVLLRKLITSISTAHLCY